MTITAPTHADVLPVGPSIDDPDNFDPEADAFVADLRPFGIQMNSLSDNVYANALATKDLADAADASADEAAGYAAAALASKNAALMSEGHAHDSEVAAAASATLAATSAAGVTASSTTSLAIGAGAKTFAVPAGKQFPAGVPMVAVSASDPTKRVFGPVQSYSGTSLTLNVTSFDGTGSVNDWNISPSGARGPTGGTAGGQLTGALDGLKGSDLVSAGTIDPWSTGGNLMVLTGNSVINSIANAPQAGACRSLIVAGAPTINSSANVIVKGGSIVLAAGDEVDIEAETTTKFRITVRRGDGSAVSPQAFRLAEFYDSATTWVAPVDGLVRFHVAGGCGSGGVAVRAYGSTAAAASGGSGAGYSIKTVYAKAGDSFVLVPGARGSAVLVSTTSSAVNGVDGGASTVTGPGVSITASGGKGGKAAHVSTGTATAAGQTGGTASGGDFNYTGGSSGTAIATTNQAANSNAPAAAATGGAAISYKGIVTHSGAATANTSAGATNAGDGLAATGGASVGASSGDANAVLGAGVATAIRSTSGGAGVVGPSLSANNSNSLGGSGMPIAATQTPLALRDAGQTSNNNLTVQTNLPSIGTNGAAGGGLALINTTSVINPSKTSFAGTSGVAGNLATSGSNISAQGCDYGGATGGVAVVLNTSVSVSSGDAGAGFVLIEHN